jgi:hypothetical protein
MVIGLSSKTLVPEIRQALAKTVGRENRRAAY